MYVFAYLLFLKFKKNNIETFHIYFPFKLLKF